MSMNLKNDHPLAVHRWRARMSQSQLAERVGVTQNNISKWERGLIVPSRGKLRELAKIFHLSPGALLDEINGWEITD